MDENTAWFPEDALGELGPLTKAEELEALLGLDPEARRILVTRYSALHAYSELAKPTSRDAQRLAATIGMGRTNFLRLYARVREHGAAVGLVRHRRARPKLSTARDGLPDLAERVLASVLASDPIVSLAQAMRGMRRSLPERDVPSTSTLRRRLYAARQAGGRGPAAEALIRSDATFGRRIAVAGTMMDLVVDRGEEYGFGRYESIYVGLVFDLETRLLVGAGVSPVPERAMNGAITDIDSFLRDMPVGDARIARDPPSIISLKSGSHPDGGLDADVDVDADHASEADDGGLGESCPTTAAVGKVEDVEAFLTWSDPEVLEGRSFRLLSRLVGDRLGGIRLRPSPAGSNEPPAVGSSLEEVRSRVAAEVDRWNYLILCARAGVKPDFGREVVARRLRRWSRREEAAFSSFNLQVEGLHGSFFDGTAEASSVHFGAERPAA